MLRISFPSFEVAFSERGDGDLRVGGRSAAAAEPLAEVQERILATLGVRGIVVPRQVHGTNVLAVDEPVSGYQVGACEGDAVATSRRALAAAVHVADCLPIAIGGEGAVAIAHAGWRGLAGGVVAAAVGALRGGGAGGELCAAIGPGAGGCCYEVGEELAELFPAFVTGGLLDLKAVAVARLREAGVGEVRDVGVCTICAAPERLFSHRRDGPPTGRQGGFAWLR
jgi:polyphenol oxidase